MPFVTVGGLRALQFKSLQVPGVEHAIFTRQGGVSAEPWRSLNVGGSVGDLAEHVAVNRMRMFEALGRASGSMGNVWQVHSDRVVVMDQPSDGRNPVKADAMITDRPTITLMMRFADCVPILAFDPRRGVAGMAHAGWKGTLSGIARGLVDSLRKTFGSRPEDLLVGIGPSIAVHHYPVGPDVVSEVKTTFGAGYDQFLQSLDGEVRFDLWAANRWHLQRSGVTEIETCGVCTACQTEDWFSHRAEAGKTGRFGALMYLTE